MEFHLYVKHHVFSFDPVSQSLRLIYDDQFNHIKQSLNDIQHSLDYMEQQQSNTLRDIINKLETINVMNIPLNNEEHSIAKQTKKEYSDDSVDTSLEVDQEIKSNTLIIDEKNHCSNNNEKFKQFIMVGTNKGGTMEVHELLNKYCYTKYGDNIPVSVLDETPFKPLKGNGNYPKIKNIYDNNQLILHVVKHPINWMTDICQFIIKQNITMYHKLYQGRDSVKETTFARIDASRMTNKECQSKMLDNKYYITFNFEENTPTKNISRPIYSYYAKSVSRLQEMDLLINSNISVNFEYRINYIFVRYEDLISKGSQLINELCNCIDGYQVKPEINVMSMLSHRTNIDDSVEMNSDEYKLFQYYLGAVRPQLTSLKYSLLKNLW